MRNTLVLLLALASSALAGPQLKAHPLLLLPGFASGRLRTWRDKYCKAELAGLELGGRGAGYKVGDAVWIDTPMIVAQRACFLKCMRLQNGTDPEPTDDGMGSCRLRADEGLDAISQLDPGIITGPLTDVWWTFIQRMSNEMGVAPEDGMVAAPYDWRLSPDMLQMRDNFFTKLRHLIEEQVLKRPGVDCGSRPDHCPGIVVVAHSMGNNVFRYFVEWLEADLGSRHYKKWLDRYVFMFAAVGAPWIGASEAVRSIFSGNTFGLPVSVAEARSMGSTFGSAPIMMPVGTPGEDPRKNSITQLRFDSPDGNGVFGAASLIEEDGPLSSLGKHGDHVGAMFHETVQGMKRDPAVDIYKLPERLPLKRIVCAYGVNRATEAGYHYTWDEEYKVPVLEEVIYEQPPSASAPLEWQQGLPDDLSHKSGDGTVNYASLAWCKRWLGSVANVTMIPEGALLESNATIKGRNADITDFSKRTAGIPANLYWESDTTTEEGDHQYTQVWEFENVEHRDVIKAPPFLKEFVALLASARNHYSEISHAQHNMGPLYGVETRKTLGGGQVPTTNAECTWDFSQMECAFQQYCNYDYAFGDLTLSQSCRLRKEVPQNTIPQAELQECTCASPCAAGFCKYSQHCKGAATQPFGPSNGFWGPCSPKTEQTDDQTGASDDVQTGASDNDQTGASDNDQTGASDVGSTLQIQLSACTEQLRAKQEQPDQQLCVQPAEGAVCSDLPGIICFEQSTVLTFGAFIVIALVLAISPLTSRT